MIRTLLQLQAMLLRGRVVRSLRLLKQPKYLLGAVAGVGWMLFWVGRPLLSARVDWDDVHVVNMGSLTADLLPTVHLVAAIAFTFLLALPWLYPFGKLGLSFREAELTMLLQAPLTRRQVIGYGLLKSLFGTILTAFFLALILGFGGPIVRLQTFLGLLLPFVFWDLNTKWRGLFLLRQREIAPGFAWGRRLVLTGVLLVYLGALVVLFFDGIRGVDFADVRESIIARPLPATLRWLVWPGWALTAPLFATSWLGFAVAALPLVVLIVAQRELVLRHPAHFEESALEHAQAQETKKSPARRFKRLSSRARVREVFALGSLGRPELAIVWKNLMRVTRTPLSQLLLGGLASIAALALLPVLFRWSEVPYYVMVPAGGVIALFPTIAVGMTWHNDLRTEFGHIELLRTWPLAPERFVLAQVVAPALLATLVALLGATLVLAARLGSGLLALRTGEPSNITLFPDGALGVSSVTGLVLVLAGVLPLCAGGAFASSAMQNLAVLFVPAWMAESGDGAKGVAAFGRRLVFALAVSLAFALAMLPGAVLVGAAVFLQHLLGVPWTAWAFPFWGLLGAAPLMVIGWLLVQVAAQLWRDLDPSEEVLEIGR